MTDKLVYVANLCDRQSALMLSGRGDRCLIELESFGVNALIAHIGMAEFAGRGFKVTIEELQETPIDAKPRRHGRFPKASDG